MTADESKKAGAIGDEEIVEAELVDDDIGGDEAPGGMDDMLGALGGLDMGSLLGSAMEMQQQMLEAQQAAAETEVEGQAGGGVVRVVTTGGFEFRRVIIDPEAVDPDDVEMLQDLVLAAIRDAVTQAVAITESSMPSLGGLGLPGMGGGGMDLGDLLGGLGGPQAIAEYDDDDDDDDAGDVKGNG